MHLSALSFWQMYLRETDKLESTQELSGLIVAVSLSDRKGVKKINVKMARLLKIMEWKMTPMPVSGIDR